MRYRIDYLSGDCDLTDSLAQAKKWADESRCGAEVFDMELARKRDDFSVSEEDVVYTSRGKGETMEGIWY